MENLVSFFYLLVLISALYPILIFALGLLSGKKQRLVTFYEVKYKKSWMLLIKIFGILMLSLCRNSFSTFEVIKMFLVFLLLPELVMPILKGVTAFSQSFLTALKQEIKDYKIFFLNRFKK